jgi:hypothetical protein
MKKQIFARRGGIMLLCILCAGSLLAQESKPKDKMKNMDMPYKATYSSNFEMGNPAHCKLILELWKDWDDNMFDRHADAFADTVTMFFSNGQMSKGKDSVMASTKSYRGSMASAKSTIHAFMPLRSVDMKENWVAIWGSEEDTWKDGKKTMTTLHEIWRFNKDGKIDLMRQFEAKIPQGQ